MGFGSLLLKGFMVGILIFIVIGNVMAPPQILLSSPTGPEKYVVVPIKYAEYRLLSKKVTELSRFPRRPVNLSLVPRDHKAPCWEFNSYGLLLNVRSNAVKNYVGGTIEAAEDRIIKSGFNVTPARLRGTSFMVMWSTGQFYENIGGTHLPSVTIQNGGDCDDWTMVRWIILRTVNEIYGIRALYFMVCVPSHAFLAVYYPNSGLWELYDWFAVKNLFVVESQAPCPWCVARPIEFPSLRVALTAYFLGANHPYWGHILPRYASVTLYRMPTPTDPKVYQLNDSSLISFSPSKTELYLAKKIIREAWKGSSMVVTSGHSYVVFLNESGSRRELNYTYEGDGILITVDVSYLSSFVKVKVIGGYAIPYNSSQAEIKELKKPGMIGDYPAYGELSLVLTSKKLTLLASKGPRVQIELEDLFGKRIVIEILQLN